MFEDFTLIKNTRRFSKNVAVLEKGKLRVQMIVDGKYEKAYEKLFSLMSRVDNTTELRVFPTFAGEEYISFLCTTREMSFSLNYSLKSGFFERDASLLEYRGIKNKDLKRSLASLCEKPSRKESCLYLIPSGIAVLCGKRGEKSIKIRNL